jgi:hypothetical protein
MSGTQLSHDRVQQRIYVNKTMRKYQLCKKQSVQCNYLMNVTRLTALITDISYGSEGSRYFLGTLLVGCVVPMSPYSNGAINIIGIDWPFFMISVTLGRGANIKSLRHSALWIWHQHNSHANLDLPVFITVTRHSNIGIRRHREVCWSLNYKWWMTYEVSDVPTYILQTFLTKRRDQVGNTPASFPVDPGFKHRPRDWLSWQEFRRFRLGKCQPVPYITLGVSSEGKQGQQLYQIAGKRKNYSGVI